MNVSVFNFSSQSLTEGEISLLKLCPNMVPATIIPAVDTKVDILRFSRKLLLKAQFYDSDYENWNLVSPPSCYIPKCVKSTVLKGIIEDLEVFANEFPKNMPELIVKDNLTIDQRAGLSHFKRRKGILYFKADKGSGVVLLNELFYKNKILQILTTDKYTKLNRNIDYIVSLRLRSFFLKYTDMFSASERRAATKFDFRTTNIYGLPKLHKSNILKDALRNHTSSYLHLYNPLDLSFRLIFGGPCSPCSVLADFCNTLLNPFRDTVQSRLRDVFHFRSTIPKFEPEDLPFIEIVSVDIIGLYEHLEQSLGIPGLRYFLTRYSYLLPKRPNAKDITVEFVIEAMCFVLNNNTGYFNGEIYRQVSGTATGIKPAPPYADLAIGYLEIQLFYKLRAKLGRKVALYFWTNYRRYLDDGIIFWDKRLCDFNEVFVLLNCMHPSIKFTMERSDSELKYLDVLVYKTTTGFKTMVKSKDTDSGTYLPFTSSHPRHCKENIPFNMAKRVRALTDDDDRAWEQMSELSSRLSRGGYPVGLINSAVQGAMMLSTEECESSKNADEDVIAFVHTFDPSHPDLLWRVKGLVSRIFTSVECRHIFGNTKIIDSRREPSSLLRLLQHSRFDESGSAYSQWGVTRCGSPHCTQLCAEIMETDSIFFSNAGFSFRIKAKMDCNVRNVIYALFCGGCAQSYIGETVCLRDRANSHRSNSKCEDNAVMEVSRHLYECGRGFKICPIVKVKEDCKILRLVIEDGLIKLLKPDLNTDTRNLLHLKVLDRLEPTL